MHAGLSFARHGYKMPVSLIRVQVQFSSDVQHAIRQTVSTKVAPGAQHRALQFNLGLHPHGRE